MNAAQLEEILAIWSAADQFDRPFALVAQANLWEAAASQVPSLVTEIRRLQIEAKAAYSSGYMQGASAMRSELQKILANHYDSGVSGTIANTPLPASER